MSVREYLRTLPDQPLAVRRRFAVLGTTLSFVVLVLLWLGTRALARHIEPVAPPVLPSLAPSDVLPIPESSPASSPSAPAVQPSGVNVEGLSADLLKAFETPVPSP